MSFIASSNKYSMSVILFVHRDKRLLSVKIKVFSFTCFLLYRKPKEPKGFIPDPVHCPSPAGCAKIYFHFAISVTVRIPLSGIITICRGMQFSFNSHLSTGSVPRPDFNTLGNQKMLLTMSIPPQASGTTWFLAHPGQAPVGNPVLGHGCIFWNALSTSERRLIVPSASLIGVTQQRVSMSAGSASA